LTIKGGQELTIRGSGFTGVKHVFWASYPSGSIKEAAFVAKSNEEIATKTPVWNEAPKDVALVVVADGGATVTLSQNLTVIRKVQYLDRIASDRRSQFVVLDGGKLQKCEHRVAFVCQGGYGDGDLRGENLFLVKNGGKVVPRGPGTLVIHEAHALVSLPPGVSAKQIPVGALRPSYVERMVTVSENR
jgi:hypothetical protein